MEPIYGFSAYAPIKRTKTDRNIDYFTDGNGQMIFKFLSCGDLNTDLADSVDLDASVKSDIFDVYV